MEVFLTCSDSDIKLKNNVVEVVSTNIGLLVIKVNDGFCLLDILAEKESKFFIDGREYEHPNIKLIGKRELYEVEEKVHWSDENFGVLAAVFAWLSVASFWYSGSLGVPFSIGVVVSLTGLVFSFISIWLLFSNANVKSNRQVLHLNGKLRFVESESYIDRSFYLEGIQLWAPHGWSEKLKAYDGMEVDLEVSDDEHYIFSAPGLSVKKQYGDMVPAKVYRFFFYSLMISPLSVLINESGVFNESGLFPYVLWMANISIFAFLAVGVIGWFRELGRADERKQKCRKYLKNIQ